MGQLSANQLWDIGGGDCPSPYARMIPGTSAGPRLPSAVAVRRPQSDATGKAKLGPSLNRKTAAPSVGSAVDRFTLCRLLAADLIVLLAACAALSLFFPALAIPWNSLPIFVSLILLGGFSQGLYNPTADACSTTTMAALTTVAVLSITLVFIAAAGGLRVRSALATFACALFALVCSRELRQWAWPRNQSKAELRNVLIVGGGPVARSIARSLRHDALQPAAVCGFLDDELPLSPTVLGRIADLEWLARAEFVDEVILALPGHPEEMQAAAEAALRNHLDIRAVPDLPPGSWPELGLDRIGEIPVVTLHRESLPSAALFLKRLIDVTGAVLALLLASPLMAVVALLIRLDSPGPLLYSAERAGAKGRRFRCFKFRSMVADAAELKDDLRDRNQREGPLFKLDDDPRITHVGRFLRRYSLDELPQLWNVLRGEMSLVGPRPHPVDDVNHYELQHFRRLDVKPGITGLWQITARDCPSFDLNMHLDLTYIENWSLRLDLRILASTIRVLFAPEGA